MNLDDLPIRFTQPPFFGCEWLRDVCTTIFFIHLFLLAFYFGAFVCVGCHAIGRANVFSSLVAGSGLLPTRM